MGSVFEPWQEELLATCRAGRLATVGDGGLPRLVPVCYARDGATFVIAIDEKPKRGTRLARLRDLERDPRAVLLIDLYDDDWRRLAWVRVEGEGGVVERGADRPQALAALRERYPQYRTMVLEERPLIVITPRRVAAWRWSGEDAPAP